MTLYMILPFLLVSIVPNIRMVSLGRRNKRIIWRWVVTYVILCGLRDYAGIDNASYRRYYEMGYGGSVFSLFGEKEPLFIIFREVGYLVSAD